MEWTADVSGGDWLRERVDDGDAWSATMHGVVPHGFEAYARVFHPAWRDRPVGVDWPREAYTHRAWTTFQTDHPDVEVIDERVDWATAAAALGKTMHPLAQWGSITGIDISANRENDPRDPAGWRYHDPEQGSMPDDMLAALAGTLALHTSTPDDGYVALWEGWGGLVGFMGTGPSRGFFHFGDDSAAVPDRHKAMLSSSIKDRFNNVFRKDTWQEGILSREVSDGSRLELPGRDHVLFRGGVAELARADWVLHVPWRDRESEEHGFPPTAQTPSIVWPADRAWVSVTEVDYDSTIVAGTRELIAALVADPQLEALEIAENAVLHNDSDEVNR